MDKLAALWTDEAKPSVSTPSHTSLPMPNPQGNFVMLLDPRPCVNGRAVQPLVVETVALVETRPGSSDFGGQREK